MSENANEVQDPAEPKRVAQVVETHEAQPEQPEQDAGVEVRTETVVEPAEGDDQSN